jgi:hypothetical protein
MNTLTIIISFVQTHWSAIVAAYTALITAGWLTSEVLAQIPSVKANSVFQAIYNWLQSKK